MLNRMAYKFNKTHYCINYNLVYLDNYECYINFNDWHPWKECGVVETVESV